MAVGRGEVVGGCGMTVAIISRSISTNVIWVKLGSYLRPLDLQSDAAATAPWSTAIMQSISSFALFL